MEKDCFKLTEIIIISLVHCLADALSVTGGSVAEELTLATTLSTAATTTLPAAASPVTNYDEDSQGSSSNKEKKEVRRFRCEVVVPER